MIQVKTFSREKEKLVDYEKHVNEFCSGVKVYSINTNTRFGKIIHTIVYETEK
jgi:hypothetical protein